MAFNNTGKSFTLTYSSYINHHHFVVDDVYDFAFLVGMQN